MSNLADLIADFVRAEVKHQIATGSLRISEAAHYASLAATARAKMQKEIDRLESLATSGGDPHIRYR